MATRVTSILSQPASSTIGVGCAAHALDGMQRQQLAVQVLARTEPITELAERHQVSRKFLYRQADKGEQALEQAFQSSPPSAEGLGTEALAHAEKSVGLESTIETIHQVLSAYRPLDEPVTARIPNDSGGLDVANELQKKPCELVQQGSPVTVSQQRALMNVTGQWHTAPLSQGAGCQQAQSLKRMPKDIGWLGEVAFFEGSPRSW